MAMVLILNIEHNTHRAASQARRWSQILSRYRELSHVPSIAELLVTALPLMALWLASWFAFARGYWWASLLIAVPAAGFLVRCS